MSTGSMSMKGSEGGPSPTSTNPSSPSTSISSTEKFSAAPPWIVHQLLVSAVRWELPLNIMFRFNASREFPSLKESKKYWLDDEQGRILTKFFSSLEKAPSVPQDGQASQTLSLDLLKRSLRVDTNSALGQQGIPTSIDSAESPNGSNQAPKDTDAKADLSGMPLTVAKRMLLIHTFRENYDSANFDQALTAIDYLRDLEYSRRMKLRKAAENLGINEHDWKSTLKDDPDALAWIQEVEKGELEIEQLFASLYVDMRIWTMLQQLKTTPFDKTSALAMLNTLFPPGVRDLPNDRIIPKFMEQQRNTFFQYISVLEKSNSGAQVAKEFEKKLLSSENRHNYQSVRWRLREYINLAETMATTADCVYGIGFFRGAEDGARAVSRAETASPIRPAKDGLLSKKSLGNIRHRFTMVRQRKAPESEPNTPAEESEPVPKIGEIEVDESAVIARVKAFSRPTTFIRPMSQAALSEAFNTLRTLIVPPFIEGLPPVTTDTISAPIPEPLNIKKKERKVEESVEAMDIKLEESIEQQQSPKLKRKRSVFGLKKKYSDPVSEEIMPSLPIAETEKKERSIFGLKKKPTEPASEEIVSSLPIPGPEKKEKGLFGMKKKRTDPLSEDIISSLPILESDKKERSLFGLKKKSTDSTPKEPPQPLPISEADKGKKEKYSLRGMRSLSSFKFRRQLDSRSTTPFTNGSKPSTPDTMEIIPAFPLPTRFSQDIRNFSRPRTATNDSSPQNPSLIARPATADGGSPPLPKRSPGKLRRQGTLLPLAPDDEFKSYFDTDEPAVLRKKSLKGARRGVLRRPASNHR